MGVLITCFLILLMKRSLMFNKSFSDSIKLNVPFFSIKKFGPLRYVKFAHKNYKQLMESLKISEERGVKILYLGSHI